MLQSHLLHRQEHLHRKSFGLAWLCLHAGMTGLSMGGVHACMTSALYPADVATAALLAPRSAAIAYCDGALSAAMAWQPLLNDADEANNSVLHVSVCVCVCGPMVLLPKPACKGAELPALYKADRKDLMVCVCVCMCVYHRLSTPLPSQWTSCVRPHTHWLN